jgi:hypothetical protein
MNPFEGILQAFLTALCFALVLGIALGFGLGRCDCSGCRQTVHEWTKP